MSEKPPFKRRTRPLAELVEGCIAPVLAAQGFAASDIVVGWPEIVGARLAPFALEVQHLAPIIIERVNARYGWRCIGRLTFRQGPVGRDRGPKPARHDPSPELVAKTAAELGSFENAGLRDALARLGAGIVEAGPKR